MISSGDLNLELPPTVNHRSRFRTPC